MEETVVIASIKGRWCLKIFGLLKLFELRKTVPNLPTPFRVLVYCSKAAAPNKDACFLDFSGVRPGLICVALEGTVPANGKIIGEFVCESYADTAVVYGGSGPICNQSIIEKSCVPRDDVLRYGNGKTVYAWRVSNPVLYRRPKDLSECGFTRAPQSWQYLKINEDIEV